jgi:hypothetical protein
MKLTPYLCYVVKDLRAGYRGYTGRVYSNLPDTLEYLRETFLPLFSQNVEHPTILKTSYPLPKTPGENISF